jgi:hypothetical protein
MTTGRSRDAARLFDEAARLLSNLTAAGKALPPPNFSASKPSDWTEAHSYANCVERLRDALDTSFVVAVLPATETAGGGDRDEQFAIVPKLFHQASRLLSDLTASGKRLPEREVEKLRARIAGARGLRHERSSDSRRLANLGRAYAAGKQVPADRGGVA